MKITMMIEVSEGHQSKRQTSNEMWTYRRFIRELEKELAIINKTGFDNTSKADSFNTPNTDSDNSIKTGVDKHPETGADKSSQAEPERGRTFLSPHVIGKSEAGMPIFGFVFGDGPNTVTLVAGAHADEPAGPNTLYRLSLEMFRKEGMFFPLCSRYRFLVIPHINPDGDAANSSWIARWPELSPFLSGMIRELPGRDIEFGYPQMRIENRVASDFWMRYRPADVHFSMHGMQFSEGFLLLISDSWEARTRNWREKYSGNMQQEGLEPHDHDRGGDKGFHYMGPGFTSTPKGTAMREYFLSNGDHATAEKFHDSSMEFQSRRNPGALCMVTELPLFLMRPSGRKGIPENYIQLREELGRTREMMGETGSSASTPESGMHPEGANSPQGAFSREDAIPPKQLAKGLQERFDIHPLPMEKAMRLHRFTILSALELYESSPFFKKASSKTDMD